MVTHARGLVCLCLTEERCDELGLRQMTDQNETPFGTAFTVTVEAREGVTTGISAHDRAHTIQVAVDPSSGPRDLVQPGHIFPLRARRGGVLQRSGPDRGRGRPGAARRRDPGGRRLRDHEGRRDDGPRPRPRRVLRHARAEDDHGRRPDRVPAPPREARRADHVRPAADRLRRVHGGRVPRDADRQAPRRARQGRGRRRAGRARARPLRVPHRRRLPLAQVRLRRAARARARRIEQEGRACCSISRRRAAGSAS